MKQQGMKPDSGAKEGDGGLYKGGSERNNQARETTIKQGKNVFSSGGSLYSGPADLDEKSKTK